MLLDKTVLNEFKEFCKKNKVKDTFANFIVWKDKYRAN